MKNRLLLVAALTFTMVGFAQKNEIKSAEKALKSGDSASAQTAIEAASGTIAAADEKTQAQYYFTRGKIYSDLAKKGNNDAFEKAATSFKKVIEIEEATGKQKYSAETNQYMAGLTADLVNSAVSDNGNNKYKEAAEKLYMSYTLSPKDTSYLYYAAGSAVNGGHYEMALDYYNKLQEVGYDGSAMVYKATNAATGEVEEMDKVQRDLMVKSGTYSNPVDEKTPSKKAEIVKNTALIYTQLGQDEKALEAYQAARKSDPEDVNLILNEANLYFNQGNKDKFKELMAQAIALAPDNPDLHYNVGVISMEQNNYDDARVSYKKAIELDPKYTNAYLNLSTTYVNEGNGMIDEMNSLGNSRADIAKYDELKEKKDGLFKQGADVLEDALKNNPDNENVMTQLKNIYGAMGDTENFMKMKKMLGE
ncbi:tetratricopeptide repeat protein [Maribacter stanieri]|uniref:Tetratricopeptide repeat-containing protein n=1 Tax=Maribacter stanieri TaxID=440514 RepID=A0A1I6JJ47_9FLAO|nr:tetratricopeptide repeat protein [Maribacter stanieri]SFR78924.1 Tetratricopeptide repeat-containing protein [Maribacter stanieri]|tara:strand:- start:1031 stop:2293 length:1263 start_codon:yes stop_codon:yes gene_type:complete